MIMPGHTARLLILALGALGVGCGWASETCDAIVAGDLDHANRLVQGGARVNAGGGCALKEAAQRGHFELVRLLLDRGADPNRASWGEKWISGRATTTLELAVQSRDARVVRLLLERGADPRADYEAFAVAIRFGDVAIAELLLQHGADPNMADPEDESVAPERLDEAARRTRCTLSGGETLLLYAVLGARGRDDDIIRLLLSHGADPNARGRNGQTALMDAASGHAHRVMTTLMAAGADVKAIDRCGRTAAEYADLHPPRGGAEVALQTKALLSGHPDGGQRRP